MLLLLFACDAAPCIAECEDDRGFWEACMAADGTLCGGVVTADCWNDADAYLACADADYTGDTCDLEQLEEEGAYEACASPDAAVASCKVTVRARFQQLEADERAEERDECREEPTSDFGRAFEDRDCEALCALLGE